MVSGRRERAVAPATGEGPASDRAHSWAMLPRIFTSVPTRLSPNDTARREHATTPPCINAAALVSARVDVATARRDWRETHARHLTRARTLVPLPVAAALPRTARSASGVVARAVHARVAEARRTAARPVAERRGFGAIGVGGAAENPGRGHVGRCVGPDARVGLIAAEAMASVRAARTECTRRGRAAHLVADRRVAGRRHVG